nr:hypothetical protein GCM10025730_51240 [Promicromonospora thailandica]
MVPALHRHAILLPAAGLLGAFVVVLADAVVRAVIGAEEALSVPTGVATTLAGALVMVVLARRLRDAGPSRRPPAAVAGPRSTRRFAVVLGVCVALAVGVTVLGLLAGSTWLRTGDIALWLEGQGPAVVRFALDERAPRVLAALAAGAALALAGTMVQATARNPLAEPGILGITGERASVQSPWSPPSRAPPGATAWPRATAPCWSRPSPAACWRSPSSTCWPGAAGCTPTGSCSSASASAT